MANLIDFSKESYRIDMQTGEIISLARDQDVPNTVDRTIQDLFDAVTKNRQISANTIPSIIFLANRCKTEMSATSPMSKKMERVLEKVSELQATAVKQKKPTENTGKAASAPDPKAKKPEAKEPETTAASAASSRTRNNTAPKKFQDLTLDLIQNIAQFGTLDDAHALAMLQRPVATTAPKAGDAEKFWEKTAHLAKLAAEGAAEFWPTALEGKEDKLASALVERFMNSRILPFQFPEKFENCKANVRYLDLMGLFGATIGSEFLAELHRHFPHLQGLRFLSGNTVMAVSLQQIADHWKGLEELYIANAFTVGAPDALTTLTKLRSLTLFNYPMSDTACAVLATCTALEYIDLDERSVPGDSLTQVGFRNLLSLPNLRDLSLHDYSITDSDLALLASDCTMIESFRCHTCHLTTAGIGYLKSLPHLQHLYLGIINSEGNPDALCAEIKDLLGLRSLSLIYTHTEKITVQGFADILSLPLLQNLHAQFQNSEIVNDSWFACFRNSPQLQSLSIESSCPNVTDNGFAYLAHLPELHTLQLNVCQQLTDKGVQDFIPKLQRLRNLKLFYCDNITDESLKTIGALPQLQSLDLGLCDKITGAGIAYIKTLGELQYLNLSSCPRITDDALEYLSSCSQLQKLLLQQCAITGSGLHHLKSLKKLRELDLYSNSLTFQGLLALSRLTQVTQLRLDLNPTITDDDLLLFRHCTQLQMLSLINCTGLTHEGVTTLRRLLPNTLIQANPT